MTVVLFRVDERLIHGQVVVGWGSQLRPQRIVVVDDEIASSDWEQELYCVGLPEEVIPQFVSVDAARAQLTGWRSGTERVMVLTRDVATMTRLGTGGLLQGAEVNIGGLHHAPGRREVLPYVYLSDAEAAALRQLVRDGVDVSARDLPGTRRIALQQLLEGGERS